MDPDVRQGTRLLQLPGPHAGDVLHAGNRRALPGGNSVHARGSGSRCDAKSAQPTLSGLLKTNLRITASIATSALNRWWSRGRCRDSGLSIEDVGRNFSPAIGSKSMRTLVSRNLSLAILLASLTLFTLSPAAAPPPSQTYATWSEYAGGADSMQYSALKQINKSNVGKLELTFFYPAPGPSGRFAFSPLIVDDVMYVVGKDS